jgi:hypothetical protein
VPNLADVRRRALSLPEATEGVRHGQATWSIRAKAFVWERTFSKADLERFGDDAIPTGTIVAVRVDDLSEKGALLASGPEGFFTIPHFDGYAAILIQLEVVSRTNLDQAIVDGWLCSAPKTLVRAYLSEHTVIC